MDHAERLADYLAGELAADERAALEAQLARDPALRRQLEALQRADASLAELESPAPSEGFERRTDARLERELDAIFAAETPAAAGTAPSSTTDELAVRRARRAPPRWVIATSGAAAALVVVAGVGIAISGGFGIPSEDELATEDGAIQPLDADDAPTAERAESPAEAADGPLVVARDRELDDAAADRLVEDGEALELAFAGLDPDTAAGMRPSYLDVFALRADAPEILADEPDSLEEADDEVPAAGLDTAHPFLRTSGPVTDAQLADVSRCLGILLEDSPNAIPVYAELATRDGEEVVALGLVDEDPGTGRFERRELWILSRDGCEVRHFVQR